MKFYQVIQKYYDNGKVEAHIHGIEADKKPEQVHQERPNYDLWIDFFKDYDEAARFLNQALNA